MTEQKKRVPSLSVDKAAEARKKITAEALQPFRDHIKELETQLETTKGDLSALLKSALNERKTRIKQDAKLSQLRTERDKLKEDIQIGINIMQDGDNMKPEELIKDIVDYFNRVLAGEDMNEPDAQAQKGGNPTLAHLTMIATSGPAIADDGEGDDFYCEGCHNTRHPFIDCQNELSGYDKRYYCGCEIGQCLEEKMKGDSDGPK